ncbi:MAG: flagellar basal body L-ring protein FlgH [Alphaproteobacteria bacterium]
MVGTTDTTGRTLRKQTGRLAALLLVGTVLGGCNALSRLADVGQPPALSAVDNPTHSPTYKPISMPMPEPKTAKRQPNSLWRPGSRAFFKDLRANNIGDIVTVVIAIDDDAAIGNTTTRTRNNTENLGIDNLFGYEGALNAILPEAVDPPNLLGTDSNSSNTGTGTIDREEEINIQLAAVVTQVLPNGNLVIHGRQETRVNFEVRELQIIGVIRPQDITSDNTVPFEDIAEARLAYGGRGHITDVQQPRYGTQILDIVVPF